MGEWSTYTLQDFLLFSPATWARLLAAHNAAVWPLHLLTLGAGLCLPVLLRSGWRHRHRAVGAILAACWLWVAWSFLLVRYATINWAAPWFAVLFAIQAAVLLLVGLGGKRLGFGGTRSRAEVVVFLAFLLAQPVAGLLTGRPWAQAEAFGILPDPTAMGTLGIALLSPRQSAWLLSPIPVLWCLIAGATLWTMDAADAWVAPAAAGAALVLMAARGRRQPRL